MEPEDLFKMSLSSGEDIVKINDDVSFTNNLLSATFTRWSSYASSINAAGSYDTESWTRGQRFTQGKVAMSSGNIWSQFSSSDLINMKKSGTLGWVPNPTDINSSTNYQCAETTYCFLPKNSANPEGAAAYYYTLRYMSLNPSSSYEDQIKSKYLNDYGWSEEEYDFLKNMNDHMTAITFNWMHIPDFEYTSLWNVFTDDWPTLVEEVYPSLQSALDAQNN